ncbi:unnamed protein product [Cuscuta campestris]|uniref:Uncharacterized protein n=1 Tax=Cuscuta campestris TaxID=132261 RepID=A0A484MV78_9ASTE|nr:unnamed protein product [Cuscuta campestris]
MRITEIQRSRKLNIWLGLDLCAWLLDNLQSVTQEGYIRSSQQRENKRLLSVSFQASRIGNHFRLSEFHQDGKVWINIPEGNQGLGVTSFTSYFKVAFDSLRLSLPPPPPFLDKAFLCFNSSPTSSVHFELSISSYLLTLDIPRDHSDTPIDIPPKTHFSPLKEPQQPVSAAQFPLFISPIALSLQQLNLFFQVQRIAHNRRRSNPTSWGAPILIIMI